MADRVVCWHIPVAYSGPISLPRFYMDADYALGALHVFAETTPVNDVLIDIRADGVSIFANTPAKTYTTAGQRTTVPTSTAVLVAGDSQEDDAEDFNGNTIEQGAWLSCHIIHNGGAAGLSINLELNKVGEDTDTE